MQKSACISFWSVDAILTLCKYDLYKTLTPELISRLSAFVDSYILFEKVHIQESYSKEPELELLGGNDIFDYILSEEVTHSDAAHKGITIDLDIISKFKELSKDDKYWSIQHDPEFLGEAYDELDDIGEHKTITKYRLWQWCALNEISEKFGATVITPNSLSGIERFNNQNSFEKDITYRTFCEFSEFWSNGIVSASKYTDDPYLDTVKSFPPFLAVLLDRSSSRDYLIENLKTMRGEYQELRGMREHYSDSIINAKSVGEKRDIISHWNSSWERMLSSEFKRSGLLSKEVSSSDIVKLAFDATNIEKILQFLAQTAIDYGSEVKSSRRFHIYNAISKDADSVYFERKDLYQKFGIENIVER